MAQVGRVEDHDLLRTAATRLRRDSDVPLVFGGLRDEHGVPVTLTSGEITTDLSSITIRPAAGLGGKTWLSRRPAYVRDYGTSPEITHEYDRQILGERVTFLAVVPIVVRDDVRGLLYAGTRGDAPLSTDAMDALVAESRRVAGELEIRDEVDRRIGLREAQALAGPETTERQRFRDAFAEMRTIARETSDPHTRAQLLRLLEESCAPAAEVTLTDRQLDVMGLVAMGCRNAEIADRLGLGRETVKSYLRSAMARLGARSRHEAVTSARRAGLLP